MDQPTNQSFNQSIKVNQSFSKSITQPTNQSNQSIQLSQSITAHQTTNQFIIHSINQSINQYQQNNQLIHQSTNHQNQSYIHLLIPSSLPPFLYSFIHSFIHSFINSVSQQNMQLINQSYKKNQSILTSYSKLGRSYCHTQLVANLALIISRVFKTSVFDQ